MRRASTLLLVLVSLAFASFQSNTSAAPLSSYTYTIEDVAVGYGTDIYEARIDAYATMWEKIGLIELGLPEGHEIVGIVVESEAPINSTTYQVDFYVLVQWGVQGEGN